MLVSYYNLLNVFRFKTNYVITYVRPNNRFTYSPILFCICIFKHFVLAEEGRDRKSQEC